MAGRRRGALVSIAHDGKLGVMRGLIHPEDQPMTRTVRRTTPGNPPPVFLRRLGGRPHRAPHRRVACDAGRASRRWRSAQQRGLWAMHCPGRLQAEALWDWSLTQDADTPTKLLAYCVACTVKPMCDPCADQIAEAVALVMAP